MGVCTGQKMELSWVHVDIFIFLFYFYRMNQGEKDLVTSQINYLSYFKKKQFIALVAKLKNAWTACSKSQQQEEERDYARESCQEARRELGQHHLLFISVSMVLLTRGLRKPEDFAVTSISCKSS